MTNNSNSFDLDPRQVKDKTWDNDVVRATVLDVLPEIHAVRVNPRGGDSPLVAPVLTPTYGTHTLPGENERVTLLYIAENVPIVLGSIYLADGQNPPDAEVGDVVYGNSTGSQIRIREDGSISIETDEFQPIDIHHQSASVRMSTDQPVDGDDEYYTIEFDTVEDDPEDLFDTDNHTLTVRHGGQHRVEATVEIQLAGQNNRYTLALYVNGNMAKRKDVQSAVNARLSVSVSTQRKFDDGDVLDIRLRQNSGSERTVNSDTMASEFSIERHGI